MNKRRIAANSTNKSSRGRDFYPTDELWTRALLTNITLPQDVWEPAAGDGAMARVLAEKSVVRCTDIITGVDFLQSTDRADAIITNPPFSLFNEFALHAYRQSNYLSAMLLGIHMLGGSKRMDSLWAAIPPTMVIIIPERMRLETASQFNHVWAVWDKRIDQRHTEVRWQHAIKKRSTDED
jgi:hypothetical protein